jgi:hypothetical protein
MHNGLKGLRRETNLMEEFPSASPKTRKSHYTLASIYLYVRVVYSTPHERTLDLAIFILTAIMFFVTYHPIYRKWKYFE